MSTKFIIPFYKNIGETPLDVVEHFKKNNIEYRQVPMTYAGRLDPLAEGLLILLAGEECIKKDEYTSLSKEYELTILFGFSTDTYDLLGKVTGESKDKITIPDDFSEILKKFTGKITQKYPPYSSRTTQGKPLWQWAREGKLDKVEIPTHQVIVHSIDVGKFSEITGKELLNKIKKVVQLVSGDFRQEEILKIWEEELVGKEDNIFPILKIVVNAGSGTYMRVLANDIGEMLDVTALAYHIKRTKIGEYTV